jgi:hypothetical protein
LHQHLNLITDQQTEFTLAVVVVMEITRVQVDQVVEVVHQEELVQLTQAVVVQMVPLEHQVELL